MNSKSRLIIISPNSIRFKLITLILLLSYLLPDASLAAMSDWKEQQNQVKAAVIFNLARFVKWNQALQEKDIQICLYQENFLGSSVDAIEDKTLHNKNVRVRVVKATVIDQRCEVIVIPESFLEKFLKHHDSKLIKNHLTITDLSNRPSDEMINTLQNKIIFRLRRDDVRLIFEVNTRASEKLEITIGSEVLKLGRIIEDEVEEP